MYQLTPNPDCVIRLDDGVNIPRDHRWWSDFEAWCAGGGEPLPVDSVPTVEKMQDFLRAEATRLRWECETGGITIAGVRVGTKTEDQNRISTVLAAADLGTVNTIDFKADSGWVTLSVAQIRQLASSISAHVQACFTAERAHHNAIEALDSMDALRGYDVSSGWPA